MFKTLTTLNFFLNIQRSIIGPSHCDFRLQESSSARNNGIEHQIYQIFQDTFGIDIRVDKNNLSRPQNGIWYIGAYEYDGSTGITKDNTIANRFLLYQNYPNSFKEITNIKYYVSTPGFVSIKIYDITGREIVTLVHGTMPAGTHTVQWDGSNTNGQQVGSGVYLFHLSADSGIRDTKRIVLINQ